jgi:hypothetical protein
LCVGLGSTLNRHTRVVLPPKASCVEAPSEPSCVKMNKIPSYVCWRHPRSRGGRQAPGPSRSPIRRLESLAPRTPGARSVSGALHTMGATPRHGLRAVNSQSVAGRAGTRGHQTAMWGPQPSPKSRGCGLATGRPRGLHPYWRNHEAARYPRAPCLLGSRHVKYAGGLTLAALFVTNCGGTNATNSWNYLVKGPYIQQD